jgi:hypothetical protein
MIKVYTAFGVNLEEHLPLEPLGKFIEKENAVKACLNWLTDIGCEEEELASLKDEIEQEKLGYVYVGGDQYIKAGITTRDLEELEAERQRELEEV